MDVLLQGPLAGATRVEGSNRRVDMVTCYRDSPQCSLGVNHKGPRPVRRRAWCRGDDCIGRFNGHIKMWRVASQKVVEVI